VRDVYDQLRAAGITVIGISPDSPKTLAKFRSDNQLPFVLASDPDRSVAKAYGAWGKRNTGEEGLLRSHFAVDEHGNITVAEVRVKPEDTAVMALGLVG